MVLKAISGKRRKPRKTLTYGVPGCGKTTLMARISPDGDKCPGAENVAFIATEEGTNDIDCNRLAPASHPDEPLCRSFGDVLDCVSQLYTEEHSFTDAVIDSLDWLERLIHAEIAAKHGRATIAEIDYGKGYDFAMPYWAELMQALDALREHRDMGIWMIAHAQIEKFNNPETDPYDRYSPNIHKKASHVIREWCDEVLFVNYKVYTEKTDEGFGRKRIKGVGQPDPYIFTRERPAHIAKQRLGLPEEMPLDWRAYAHYAGITPAE